MRLEPVLVFDDHQRLETIFALVSLSLSCFFLDNRLSIQKSLFSLCLLFLIYSSANDFVLSFALFRFSFLFISTPFFVRRHL